MKALTVQQPWAWAIIHGGKDVENRTQLWRHRGPLAIHAGRRWSERGVFSPLVVQAWWDAGGGEWVAYDREGRLRPSVPMSGLAGQVIGTVDLVDVHLALPGCCDSPWAEYTYQEHPTGRTRRDITHLVLEHPRPLDLPLAAPGKLGLWDVDL